MSTRTIQAGPSKRFFVEMLPRDISLEHAVLDLIDNSLDGAIRQRIHEIRLNNETPYKGLKCELTIAGDQFEICDNCGGIPDDRLDAALKLGRDDTSLDQDKPTIGMYGIGMKRSIFKIASDATVVSANSTSTSIVRYSKAWMNPQNEKWDLRVRKSDNSDEHCGVRIRANEIRPLIAKAFASKPFMDDLIKNLSRYYAYIIEKGFEIHLNGKKITALPVEFNFSEEITPFYFNAQHKDVNVTVVVGLFRKLTREDEREAAIQSNDNHEAGSHKAGITVVCNDRVIKHADTTSVTGWGLNNVPRYHPQFRAITGILIFESDDASKLPVSTTKGALDLDEEAYLVGLNACMEGIKTFTQFTNRFKGIEEKADVTIAKSVKAPVATVTSSLSKSARTVRNSGGTAKKLAPTLPEPKNKNPMARVSFSREKSEIERVGSVLGFGNGASPSEIGEQVWKEFLKKNKVND